MYSLQLSINKTKILPKHILFVLSVCVCVWSSKKRPTNQGSVQESYTIIRSIHRLHHPLIVLGEESCTTNQPETIRLLDSHRIRRRVLNNQSSGCHRPYIYPSFIVRPSLSRSINSSDHQHGSYPIDEHQVCL